ncbi:hypothetical protein TcasGA2_TC004513 [Tribolium castaneum]|uniref:Uncharacterized protein n=1 Tax=Tribolium castaneum TaxID=7070 RepID=D6WBN3_TRICA|nr:hypothetical protein TcasGA2_TC004513 [Tribolium castaneum]
MSSYSKHTEDSLPKVIICGMTENNMPKLIVCDEKKLQDDKVCTAQCSQKSSREDVAPNLSQRLVNMQKQLVAGNAGLTGMSRKLECDLLQKNRTIENLQKQLCQLQCEMNNISKQNAILNEKIEQATGHQKPDAQIPCGKNYACLESRLNEYTENTKALEKQLCEMESHVEAMKSALTTVQAERANLEKSKNILMLCPPPMTCPRPVCPKPRHCSFKGSISDQQLANLDSGETTTIFKKFSQIWSNKLW